MQISVSRSAAESGTQAIRSFFANRRLHDALYCFDRLMTAACADKLLLNTVPANHLFFVSELKRLAEGATLALMEELGSRCLEAYLQVCDAERCHAKAQREKQNAQLQPGLIPDEMGERIDDSTPATFDDHHQWMDARLGGTQWQNFPRHLTARQFDDPWLAVEAFADHASATRRDDQLDILLEQALGRSPVDLFITSSELVKLQRSWRQLLEGCHLLAVRGLKKNSIIFC